MSEHKAFEFDHTSDLACTNAKTKPSEHNLTAYMTAGGLANLGEGIATVAWVWVASCLTREPTLIALVAIALRLPKAVFALPAGIVADRVNRRSLIVHMDVLRSALFALTAALLWIAHPFGDPPESGMGDPRAYVALVLTAFMVGTADIFRNSAAVTMLPQITPKEKLESANGHLWSIEITTYAFIGPAVGAFLVSIAPPLPYVAKAFAYCNSAFMVSRIKGTFQPKANPAARNWRRELSEAAAFLRGEPLLLTLAWVSGFWNLFVQMVMIALVLHAQENLGVSAKSYGLLLAGGAAGGVIGGVVGKRVIRWFGPARSLKCMMVGSVLAFLGIAFAPGPVSMAMFLGVFQFTGIVWSTVALSTRQRMTPTQLFGRVNSLYRLFAFCLIPTGLLVSGFIVSALEGILTRGTALTAPFFAAAVGLFVVTAFAWQRFDRMIARSDPGPALQRTTQHQVPRIEPTGVKRP